MKLKINFKQPKYIFPLVIFVPLCYLIGLAFDTFGIGDSSEKQAVATDHINATIPEARAEELGDKMYEMSRRFDDEEAFTAVSAIGEEKEVKENIGHGYSEDELNSIDAAEAERARQQQEIEELERRLAESQKHINSYAYADSYQTPREDEDFARDLEEIQARSMYRQRAIEASLGVGQPDPEEEAARQRRDSLSRAIENQREKNRPQLVMKSQSTNADRFNTVTATADNIDTPLIKAMIDKTTKAHEGTRLRFKLLDDVTIEDVRLPKGTYLYGTVSGFGQQRVMARITSIMVGGRFIKVDLSVFDNDGMEGFYVPESAFRDFMRDAGANAVQQNINFDGGNYGTGISAEAIALQALQNVYTSASSAVSANIRKNKAKIKYNTIVYLINSDQAR